MPEDTNPLNRIPGDVVDHATFSQILEMDDDDDDRDFSRSIVFDFFDQADSTFEQMDTALKSSDLKQLSQLGHFLKGSSATLGLTQLKDGCEKIQHLGDGKDESGLHPEPDAKKSLKALTFIIKDAKANFGEAKRVLMTLYPTNE